VSISAIFNVRAQSDIGASIVEAIAISVIYFDPGRSVQEQSVHQNVSCSSADHFETGGIPNPFTLVSSPPESAQIFIVGWIDNCELVSSEKNDLRSDRFVRQDEHPPFSVHD